MKPFCLLFALLISACAFAQDGFSLDIRMGATYTNNTTASSQVGEAMHFGGLLGLQAKVDFSKRLSAIFEGSLGRRVWTPPDFSNPLAVHKYLYSRDIAQCNFGFSVPLSNWLNVQILPFASVILNQAVKKSSISDWERIPFLENNVQIDYGTTFSVEAHSDRLTLFVRKEYILNPETANILVNIGNGLRVNYIQNANWQAGIGVRLWKSEKPTAKGPLWNG